jgi:hypothetical protein
MEFLTAAEDCSPCSPSPAARGGLYVGIAHSGNTRTMEEIEKKDTSML